MVFVICTESFSLKSKPRPLECFPSRKEKHNNPLASSPGSPNWLHGLSRVRSASMQHCASSYCSRRTLLCATCIASEWCTSPVNRNIQTPLRYGSTRYSWIGRVMHLPYSHIRKYRFTALAFIGDCVARLCCNKTRLFVSLCYGMVGHGWSTRTVGIAEIS